MVRISVSSGVKSVFLVGQGLTVSRRVELSPHVFIEPNLPTLDLKNDRFENFADYAAAVFGQSVATFCLEVRDDAGGEILATKAWNTLWHFHLLSLASSSPCMPLYAVTIDKSTTCSAINRNLHTSSGLEPVEIAGDQLDWAKEHQESFNRLISVPEFNAAMRCFGNSHYLFEADMRIMLLWAGIEGLLSVEAELSRRVALYAALMFKGSADEKATYFKEVRKAYGVRSRAVHGGKADEAKLQEGYRAASLILSRLLARCVELGRVPKADELDALAASSSVG
jgi:hypothetical protein